MEISDLSSLPRNSANFYVSPQREEKYPVIPVFLPFMGCAARCVFCAQQAQTGQSECVATDVRARLCNLLDTHAKHTGMIEIAFYGGTFTLWPRELQQYCLRLVRERFGTGNVRIRCSTRPDALQTDMLTEVFGDALENTSGATPAKAAGDVLDCRSESWLHTLHAEGLNLIEVGVQSFDDAALERSGRGYTGETARQGCLAVRRAGMRFGAQLMPGIPGVTPDVFVRDVATALELGADCLRFYPCLVLEGTELARMWRAGEYEPWDLETTIRTLGIALSMAWETGVPVIRMGLAPGRDMEAAMLAGPWHPALGSLVQAEALAETVERHAEGKRISVLHLPSRCRGFMGGKSGPLWKRWERIGLARHMICWHEYAHGTIVFA